MPIDIQTVSIGFGPGQDTKTDYKVTSKPVLIQDGIFTNPHRISKRNGNDLITLNAIGGSTISSPTMVKSYRNEIVCSATAVDGSSCLFSYSESLSGWKNVGSYNSIEVSKTEINSIEVLPSPAEQGNVSGSSNPSSATIGNITLYAFDGGYANLAQSVYATVVDNQTGTHLSDRFQFTSGLGNIKGFSRAVVLGTNTFAVFYIGDSSSSGSPTTTARVCMQVVFVSEMGGVSYGPEVVLGSGALTGITSPNLFYYGYDVVTTSFGAFVAICNHNSGGITLLTIDTTGAVINSSGFSSSGTLAPLNVTLDLTSTNAWIYFTSNQSSLLYAIYPVALTSAVLGPTVITTGKTQIQQACGLNTGSGQTVYFSDYTQPATAFTVGVFYPIISSCALTTSSQGSVLPFMSGLDIYSRPKNILGRNYIAVMSISPTNPVGFLIDISLINAVAKFLPGSAEGVYEISGDTSGPTYAPPVIINVRYPGFINSIFNFNASVFSVCAGYVVSLQTAVQQNSGDGSATPAVITTGATLGVALISFDFNSIDAHQAIIHQDTLVLNGGIVSQYDGASVSELGFNIDPDFFSVIVDTSSGMLPGGNWVYYYVYRWTDANGNLHQSAPSIGLKVRTSSGTTNAFLFGFSSLNITQKTDVLISLYRTIDGGTIAYLVTTALSSGGYVTGIADDSLTDAEIVSNPTLYTEGNSILENIAPPPAMILWTNSNRAWCVDSENPETIIEYSKTASQGSGISFSTGQLEYVIDSKGGSVSGVSTMDEKTVLLKENGAGYFIGDGANDAGGGSTLSNFQFIPSTTGCSNSKSVVLYNDGILFRASNNKGIYKVSRGVQIGYFGLDVEAYNNQDILSALNIPNKTQIRFLTSNGSSLLYDYVMNQWSVFSNFAGLSADQFNGLYIYVRSSTNQQDNGVIFIENESTFLDNLTPYSLTVQTQWIKSASIQNFQRMRRIEMLGDYLNGSSIVHGIQISSAYDFSTSFSAPVPYYFGSASGSGYFQYRQILKQQKSDSVQFLIQEIVTGASGEYCDFTDLGLEIATKKGLNKLPGYRSVG